MKNVLCGLPISEESANALKETCDRILNPLHPSNVRLEAIRFNTLFQFTQHTNPHNRFHGTAREYIKKHLPEKYYLLEYL